MSPDRQTPNGEVGENNHFKGLLLEELAKTSDRPLEDLTLAIKGWLESQKGYNGNGDRRKFIEAVSSKIEAEDPAGAAMLFIDKKSPIPLIGSVDRTLREARTVLTLSFYALSSSEKSGVLLRGEPSPTFKLGGAAHLLMEKLVVAGENLEAVRDKKVELLAEGDNIVGMAIHGVKIIDDSDYENLKIVKAGEPSGQKTMPGFEADNQLGGSSAQDSYPRLEIKFSDPIPAPKADQGLVDWCRERFSRSLNTINQCIGELPKKPSDVEKIFDNQITRTALMQAIEIGHIFFGCQHNLSQVGWTSFSKGEISPNNVDMFAALNWLAIIRKVIEAQPTQGNGTILTEIKEGQLTFEVPVNGNGERLAVPIQGNKIDALRISAPEDLKSKKVPTWGVAEVFKYIEGVFNTQGIKHRTYRFEDGVRKLRATRFQRNVRSLMVQMYEHFGNDLFKKMIFDIDDFKFLGGDGNWSEQYDPSDLPVKEHQRQVAGYIFKVLSQLCWLEKWVNAEGERSPSESKLISFSERDEITLTVEEVVDFGLRTELLNRIRGHLLYQLPAREIKENVFPSGSSREELIEWALGVSKLGSPKTEQRDRLRIARALLTILRPSTGAPEIKRREPKTLPESLVGICFNHRGKFYLSIDDLDNLISRRVNFKELEHFSAMEFRNDGVKVIWIKGLVDGEGIIRIAVGGSGEFAISGLKSGIVKGRLLSKRANWGVHERTEKLVSLYETYIWGAIKFWRLPNPNSVDSYISDGKIIMPDGKIENLVSGKPIVCRYDLMTGKWFLDYKLLEEAVGSDAGRSDLGLRELADLIDRKSTAGGKSTWCPMPTHKNVNTRAAIFNPESVNCQSGECGVHVYLPSHAKMRVEKAQVILTHSVQDFKPVSKERAETFEGLTRIGSIFAAESQVAQRYVIEERGLSPSDLGVFGYIPAELEIGLETLIFSHTFGEMAKRIKHKDDYHLGIIDSMLEKSEADDVGVALEGYRQAVAVIGSLPEFESDKVLRSLNIKTLTAMRMRAILERKHRLSERIILPTYWISGTREKNLVQANFNARGIVLDGVARFNEQPHHKAYLAGEKKRGTPAGFYIRNPEKFMRLGDSVIVTEGPFNNASLARILPAPLSDFNITSVGLGYHELVAFLRWLGVSDDSVSAGRGLDFQIKNVFLAFDFDLAGARAYAKRVESLKSEFPSLRVLPIHEILPDDVKGVVPSFDQNKFAEGGEFEGFKLDLNDLVKSHSPAWAEESGIDPAREAEIAKLRKKYAYFKPS